MKEPTVSLHQLLQRLLKQEQEIIQAIEKQPNSEIVLPIGVVWYYVILLMIGNKIDYLVPVTRLARTLILLLSLCRFLFLGAFLSILMKPFTK